MKHRSIFWPLVLIATGITWLLISMGQIPTANLWALAYIMPFILIALGLGLILRAYWDYAGMFVSLLVVAGAVMAIIYAPQYGWDKSPNWVFWNIGPDFGGAVKGSGIVKTETREVSDFNSIMIGYPAEVTVKQGEKISVSIEAEDNLLPQLSFFVGDGTLHLSNSERNWEQRVNPTQPVKLTITVVDLNGVSFSTVGKINIDGLETEYLQVIVSGVGDISLSNVKIQTLNMLISGAGNITASGQADKMSVRISGMGDFSGSDLQTQTAEVSISGAGSANLWVEQSLETHISGAGSVNYFGNPSSIEKSISGAGSVKSLGEK